MSFDDILRPKAPVKPSDEELLLVYNTYLAEMARANDRPYRKASSLKSLDEKKLATLCKLTLSLRSMKDVSMPDFFRASFVRTHEKYLEFSYFSTMKAVGNYKRFRALHG